ncbi:MAG: 50S ribosomal protein L24 [Chloroflexota bacterium]|jgi:large subunit ribosomal protein L24|nr:50S ribosomal protein L24 [Chloroflexota bacterium]
MKTKIRKGDRVVVISGNDKGTVGEVIRVIPDESRVVVQGVNIRIKHQAQTQTRGKTIPAGKIEFEAPIDISNVMLIDPKSGEPTRVRIEREDGKPVRVAVKSGEKID